MTQGPLLLTDRVVPDASPVQEESSEAEARRTVGALNPRFVAGHGLVGIAQSDGRLTVGSASEPTLDMREALRFATGLEIDVVRLTPEQLHALRPADPASAPPSRFETFRSAMAGIAGKRRGAPALMGERLPALQALAHLVDAGYSLRSAGQLMLDANETDPAAQTPHDRLARRLAEGGSLAAATADSDLFPPYMRRAFSACRDPAEEARALVSLAAFEAKRERQRERGLFAVAEAVLLWTVATLLCLQVALWAAVPAMVAGVYIAVRLRELTAPAEPGPSQRADILDLTALLARCGLSPRQTIRVAMSLLEQLRPTWGTLPDTREALADALGATPLGRALLAGGELGERAVREAERQQGQATASVERLMRLSRIGAVACAGAALIILVA